MLNAFRRKAERTPDEIQSRVPPGQHLTDKFPVLHYGDVPQYKNLPETWDLRVWGTIEQPKHFSYSEFRALPTVEVVTDMKARAAAKGRTLRFGYRAHVIVRETEDEARAYADRLLSKLDAAAGDAIRNKSLDAQNFGVQRQAELRSAVTLAPDDEYALHALARQLAERGELAESRELLRRILSNNPEFEPARQAMRLLST